MHPSIQAIIQYFEYNHLPAGKLQDVSLRFHNLAHDLVKHFELDGPELTVALRKLLEAKDAAVRAALG